MTYDYYFADPDSTETTYVLYAIYDLNATTPTSYQLFGGASYTVTDEVFVTASNPGISLKTIEIPYATLESKGIPPLPASPKNPERVAADLVPYGSPSDFKTVIDNLDTKNQFRLNFDETVALADGTNTNLTDALDALKLSPPDEASAANDVNAFVDASGTAREEALKQAIEDELPSGLPTGGWRDPAQQWPSPMAWVRAMLYAYLYAEAS